MRKYYRNNKEDNYSVYCVSPSVTVSASVKMGIKDWNDEERFLDSYDEESGRWFCQLGCGFRYHRDAHEVLQESTAMVDQYLWKRTTDGVVRESQAVAWTYNYDRGVFSCDYELTEYDLTRKRSTRFSVGSASAKELEEIEKAIHAWHVTGEMMWDILYIDLGDWEPYGKNAEAKNCPAQSAGTVDDETLLF